MELGSLTRVALTSFFACSVLLCAPACGESNGDGGPDAGNDNGGDGVVAELANDDSTVTAVYDVTGFRQQQGECEAPREETPPAAYFSYNFAEESGTTYAYIDTCDQPENCKIGQDAEIVLEGQSNPTAPRGGSGSFSFDSPDSCSVSGAQMHAILFADGEAQLNQFSLSGDIGVSDASECTEDLLKAQVTLDPLQCNRVKIWTGTPLE
jgi:hypothetical protein